MPKGYVICAVVIEGRWHGSRTVVLEFESQKPLLTGTGHPSTRRSSVSDTRRRMRTWLL